MPGKQLPGRSIRRGGRPWRRSSLRLAGRIIGVGDVLHPVHRAPIERGQRLTFFIACSLKRDLGRAARRGEYIANPRRSPEVSSTFVPPVADGSCQCRLSARRLIANSHACVACVNTCHAGSLNNNLNQAFYVKMRCRNRSPIRAIPHLQKILKHHVPIPTSPFTYKRATSIGYCRIARCVRNRTRHRGRVVR